MRTVLVNPRRSRKRRRMGARFSIVPYKTTSLKTGRRKHTIKERVRAHYRRTHNPTFFMANPRRRRRRYSNPLILPNRRRYRRRNPGFSMGGAFNTVLMGALGGGGAWAFNKYLVAKIQLQPDGSYPTSALYWHIGARAVASILAGFFLPTSIANASNGALAYASIDEIVSYRAAHSTGADLSGLEADLSDVLDGY